MAQMFGISSNADEIFRRFNKLPLKVQQRVIGPSLQAAGKPIWGAARLKLPIRSKSTKKVGVIDETTGALRASIGAKLVGRKRSKRSRLLVIGPRVGDKFARYDSKGNVRKPWKYAHLVERGTAHSRAMPFLRPAIDTAGQAAIMAFAVRLSVGMKKEIAKLRAKSG